MGDAIYSVGARNESRVLSLMSALPVNAGTPASKSAMMQLRGANVGAAMIAHCAEHPVLQISKGHVVGKAASVDLSVMVTVRIAANDKHTVSAVTSHVAQTRGLVVEYEVRDCPGHRLTKRVCGGSAMTLLVDQGTGQRYCPLRMFVSRPDPDEAVC